MSALVTSNPDNANPTVYSRPSGGSKRLADFLDEDVFLARKGGSSSDSEEDQPQMIWSSPRDGGDAGSDDDDEPIDQQEIFGKNYTSEKVVSTACLLWPLQTSSAPSQTQSTLSRSSSWPS